MDSNGATLTTIHRGDFNELLPLQAALNANDLHAFIADQNIKTIDPFITGGSIFQTSLQVPAYEVEQALALLQDLRPSANDAEESPAADETGPVEDGIVRLEALGLRLRWGAVLVGFLAPYSIPAFISLAIYGIASLRYLFLTLGRPAKPVGHWFTVASICVLIPLCLVYTVLIKKSPFW